MKNTWKIVPLFALVLFAFGCGPSGGAAGTPEEIGDAVKDAIVGMNFSDVYGYHSAHELEAADRGQDAYEWRWENGYERWKEIEEDVKELDPERESGLTDEDGYKGASMAERFALRQGLYMLYDLEERDDRLGDGLWYRSGRSVDLEVEGQGTATLTYSNKYRDRIRVVCVREDGLWSLSSIDIDGIPPEAPEKPGDDDE